MGVLSWLRNRAGVGRTASAPESMLSGDVASIELGPSPTVEPGAVLRPDPALSLAGATQAGGADATAGLYDADGLVLKQPTLFAVGVAAQTLVDLATNEQACSNAEAMLRAQITEARAVATHTTVLRNGVRKQLRTERAREDVAETVLSGRGVPEEPAHKRSEAKTRQLWAAARKAHDSGRYVAVSRLDEPGVVTLARAAIVPLVLAGIDFAITAAALRLLNLPLPQAAELAAAVVGAPILLSHLVAIWVKDHTRLTRVQRAGLLVVIAAVVGVATGVAAIRVALMNTTDDQGFNAFHAAGISAVVVAVMLAVTQLLLVLTAGWWTMYDHNPWVRTHRKAMVAIRRLVPRLQEGTAEARRLRRHAKDLTAHATQLPSLWTAQAHVIARHATVQIATYTQAYARAAADPELTTALQDHLPLDLKHAEKTIDQTHGLLTLASRIGKSPSGSARVVDITTEETAAPSNDEKAA